MSEIKLINANCCDVIQEVVSTHTHTHGGR